MRLRTLAAVVAVVGLSVSALAQGPRRDGKWEIKMTVNMPGMPAAMPPMTMTQCITPADAADPQKTAPPQAPGRGGAAPKCAMSNYKVEGNKVTYTMKCEPPQAATMTGEFIYGDGTYEGTMKMDMDRGGQPMSVMMTYSGKRLGDCVK
jgi:hypothetical protein